MKVLLDTIPKLQKFCTMTNQLRGSVDAISGRYKIDGKSLLGLLSLDLGKPIDIAFEDISNDVIENIFCEFGVTE